MNTKQCEVIILPNNKGTNLRIDFKNILNFDINHRGLATGQHLYIVSNEEMKVDDWCIYQGLIHQIQYQNNNLIGFKKVIASTDPKLFRQVNCSTCDGTGKIVTSCSLSGFTACDNKQCKEDTFKLYLPQIPQSFISLYIEEYNKGNKIEKVEVEYEQYGDVPYYYIYGNCKYECKYKGDWFDLTNGEVELSKSEENLDTIATKHYYSAFTNPDNTINIKPLKDSWTREEVVNLIHMSHQDCVYEGGTDMDELHKWIKTQL